MQTASRTKSDPIRQAWLAAAACLLMSWAAGANEASCEADCEPPAEPDILGPHLPEPQTLGLLGLGLMGLGIIVGRRRKP